MSVGFGQVVIDSLRADDIAGFWSALLERPVNEGANQFFAMIPASPDGTFPALMFLAVPEPRHEQEPATPRPRRRRPRGRGRTRGQPGRYQGRGFQRIWGDLDNLDRSRRQHLRYRLEAGYRARVRLASGAETTPIRP